jgi:bud site selection protein 20
MPAIRGAKSKKKTRRYTRDVDQSYADLHNPRHLERYLDTKNTEDLPALGQHYCLECSKWFDSAVNLESHRRGKPHKRRSGASGLLNRTHLSRLKQLKEEPHTQKEAEAAIGLRTDNRQRALKKPDEMNVDC